MDEVSPQRMLAHEKCGRLKWLSLLFSAQDLASARPHLKKVTGSRFTEKYLEQRYGRASIYRSAPTLPARASTTSAASSTTPSTPPASTGASSPASPSRKILSSFAAFSAPSAATLASTPMQQSPPQMGKSIFGNIPASPPTAQAGLGSAFGSMRDGSASSGRVGGMDDDEEEDEDEGVSFRQGGISLDQVSPERCNPVRTGTSR